MEKSSDTNRLHILTHTKNEAGSIFPREFIDAIRSGVDAGLTSEQITSIILLATSVIGVGGLDGPELLGRTKEVSTVLAGLHGKSNIHDRGAKIGRTYLPLGELE